MNGSVKLTTRKRKLAVFDIDGTIFRSSLLIELVNELVRQDVFPKAAGKKIDKDYLAWVNRVGHYDNYAMKVVEIYVNNIKGKHENDIKRVVKEIVDSEYGKVYRYTRDLIKFLKKKNYFLLAISGSPEHVVSEFSSRLGFDEFFGAEYEIKKNKFTGAVLSNTGLRKNEILQNFIEEYHETITLNESFGIGDTDSDVPILELVDNPIVFNPNFELAKIAKKRGWKIVVERKDVIYEIKDFNFAKINS